MGNNFKRDLIVVLQIVSDYKLRLSLDVRGCQTLFKVFSRSSSVWQAFFATTI